MRPAARLIFAGVLAAGLLAGSAAVLSDYFARRSIEREFARIADAPARHAVEGEILHESPAPDGGWQMIQRVTHRPAESTRFEYLRGRRNGGEWKARSPGAGGDRDRRDRESREPSLERKAWLSPILDPSLAAANYRATRIEPREIAGRPAVGWKLDSHRPGLSFRIWVDRETSLTLALETYARDGALLRRFAYESIEISPSTSADPPATPEPRLDPPPFTLYVPEHVPAGYRLLSESLRSADNRHWHKLTYTDGMTTLRIVQSPRGQRWWRSGARSPDQGPETEGGRPVVQHRSERGIEFMKVTLGDTTVSLAGPVEPEALTAVITSMAPRRPGP
jgi:hypothetical protein